MKNRVTVRKLWPVWVIVGLYLVVGSLYAWYTPRWQVPDEPAHYNYIRSLAEERQFPRMEVGDYDQAYLSRLLSERFPPTLPVAPLEYEDHQPPLYYLLMTPVFWLSGGSVLALRLATLLLGATAILLLMLVFYEFWPQRPCIVWFGGGLVAFLPQYVAMTAAVNNDALTWALLWLWLWLAQRYLRGGTSPWLLGGVLGAILITKSTGYSALVLAVLVVALRHRRAGRPLGWALRDLARVLLPGLLLGGLWWGRNLAVYGWPDVMGLQQHNAVVVGQPRTSDWIIQYGWRHVLTSAAISSFRSFWGQFGWMGVVMDQRIYQALLIFSGLALVGALWRLQEALRGGLEPRQRDSLLLLGTLALVTFALYLGYNLTFVQHQGRYLYTALPILALGTALGLERILERRLAVSISLVMLVLLVGLGLLGLARGDLPLWPMALVGATMVALPLVASVPRRWHPLLAAGVLLALAALDVYALFAFIVPQLTNR